MNKGKGLEDLLDKRLKGVTFHGKRFYNAIAENLEYKINNCRYEEDNFGFRYNNVQDKRYVVVVEDKNSNKKSKKAHQQLRRHYLKIRSECSSVRIFLIYVHGYKKEKGTYQVTWYKPSLGSLKQDNIKYFKGKVNLENYLNKQNKN